MKKSGLAAIVILCLLFGGFTLGFYVGRNISGSPVQVHTLEHTLPTLGSYTRPTSQEDQDRKVNINTAGQAELMELPGIGEVLSQRIIDYRTEHGSFQSLADLLNVEGIGEQTVAELLPYAATEDNE